MDNRVVQCLGRLQANLDAQVDAHEQVLGLMTQKRSALAHAKPRLVADCCERENAFVQKISELEKQRLGLAAELTGLLDPAAREPLSLSALAERLPEPERGKLLVRRQQLRQRMEEVRQQAAIAHRATESLMHHMQGLVRTVGSLMTGVGTYSAAGGRPRAAMAMSTFSTTA